MFDVFGFIIEVHFSLILTFNVIRFNYWRIPLLIHMM